MKIRLETLWFMRLRDFKWQSTFFSTSRDLLKEIFFRRPISIKVSYLKRGLGEEIVLFSGCINKEVVSTFNLVV